MIILIIIFKGMVIEITIKYPKLRDDNKHKTPYKLNFGLKRKTYELMHGHALL